MILRFRKQMADIMKPCSRKEDIEMDHDGDREDSTGTGGKPMTGCECETHE